MSEQPAERPPQDSLYDQRMRKANVLLFQFAKFMWLFVAICLAAVLILFFAAFFTGFYSGLVPV